MAVDMFLDIEGEISGEAQDSEHKGTIDVLAWSWGMSQSGSFHVGGGGGAGKVNIQDISITKWVDKSSPVLMKYCSNGDHFDSAKLIVRKAGKTPLEYIVIEMTKVMVTSVSTGGSGGEDKLTENISLNFSDVKVTYVPQMDDGTGDADIIYNWDIAGNVEK
ncbi:Hcp family type VI secretion system effector [Meridianimarinicoccus aquatilis]|uniref:Type VI secretion system tube protein Hcp n=1 Tax=Meridianimarinicoccus aquatilis TaxID=2552766 RepID=A0A4R6ANV7_9RHOB|nr:type VI secretion system tube protein Hcp [Fluviibacterium aquatile]QIE43464.1 type VI secretion system tube protein Hcp [Rhodobacteraceae bacterium SC52]TDL85185.1 type VI secretion system tube protein Hcp [Fluviibacterium aquatile]